MEEPVSSSSYLILSTKATPLAGQVTISMSYDMPIVVEYKMEDTSYIRLYLAPKIEEEEVTGTRMENVPKVDTKTKADVKPKVGKKPKMDIESVEVIEIEEGSEIKAETKAKLEKIEIDDESKPKPDIKPNEQIDIDETKSQVEAKVDVEVMDVE